MTNEQMIAEVVANLGLEDLSYYDEKSYVQDKINQGVIDLLARTRCVVRCVELAVDPGVDTYVLAQSLLALVDIEDGMTKVGRATEYKPSFTMIRADLLRLQPAPTESGELQVWAVKKPVPMTTVNDSPGMEQFGAIPEEYQDAIVTYALWKCGDYADDASSGQGERFRVLYEGQDGRGGRLAQIRSSVNKRGTSRAPRRRVRLTPVRSSSNWIG